MRCFWISFSNLSGDIADLKYGKTFFISSTIEFQFDNSFFIVSINTFLAFSWKSSGIVKKVFLHSDTSEKKYKNRAAERENCESLFLFSLPAPQQIRVTRRLLYFKIA